MLDTNTTGTTSSVSGEPSLRRDAQRNRAALMAAARELLAERGLGVTLDDVARHAGLGVGTAYRNFPNKAALIDDLLVERMQEMVDLARECLATDEPWAGLRAYVAGSMEQQIEDRGLKQLLYRHSGAHVRVEQIRAQLAPAVAALVARAHDAGVLRHDVRATDIPIITLMLGAVVDFGREADPHLYRRYLELLLAGLHADPTPPQDLHPPLSPGAFQAAIQRLHRR